VSNNRAHPPVFCAVRLTPGKPMAVLRGFVAVARVDGVLPHQHDHHVQVWLSCGVALCEAAANRAGTFNRYDRIMSSSKSKHHRAKGSVLKLLQRQL